MKDANCKQINAKCFASLIFQPNPLLWVIPKGSCNFSKEYNKLHCKNNALQVGCKILGLLLLSNELFGISRKKLIMRVYEIKAYEMAYQAYYITHLLRMYTSISY